ncbi:hypothetical protein ABT119_40455, partial [Streptomyces sp. NPDC001910]|uniref:hypothetical protein n=1 Tax=Streptomyces sp. NPDC001910 TaxID=3154403 RepID=UPI00332F901E
MICHLSTHGLDVHLLAAARFGDHIADEAFVARLILARYDRDLRQPRGSAQHGFDFAEFDAVAADLDLVVGSAGEFEEAVGGP